MMIKKSGMFEIQWQGKMAHVDRNEWDRLALPLETPFLEYNWLHQMEASGSIEKSTGWNPSHLTVWKNGRLVAAAPLYIKNHSEGEFVFDYAWADVARKLGMVYYPKMVGMAPVTPVTGYRFLIAPEVEEAEVTRIMIDEINQFCAQNGLSGCNFLFVDPQWARLIRSMGYLGWVHQSFIWQNPGYESFSDYLGVFNANQRKNIRKEIQAMEKQGPFIKNLAGDQIPENYLPLMYHFYTLTNEKFGPWGCQYLTPEFFERIPYKFGRRLLMVAAYEKSDPESPIAMSMLVTKGDQLYGRYWGCRKQYSALHFNLCYYSPIKWAVENGIKRFNPGAGGGHKVRRGFISVPSFSLHRFYNPRLWRIMRLHMDEINRLEVEEIQKLNKSLPFARGRNLWLMK